jgi:hypothetical protein
MEQEIQAETRSRRLRTWSTVYTKAPSRSCLRFASPVRPAVLASSLHLRGAAQEQERPDVQG